MGVDVYALKIVHWVVKRVAKGVQEHVKVHVVNNLRLAVMVVTHFAVIHAKMVVKINVF